jgi:hypothetical protein
LLSYIHLEHECSCPSPWEKGWDEDFRQEWHKDRQHGKDQLYSFSFIETLQRNASTPYYNNIEGRKRSEIICQISVVGVPCFLSQKVIFITSTMPAY